MNGIKWLAAVSILAGGLLSTSAQEATPDDAKALLHKLTGFYRSLEAVSVKSELVVSMGEPGKEKVIQSLQQRVRLKRPGRYAIETTGVGNFLSTPSVYLDGGKATVLVDEKQGLQTEGVTTVPALFRNLDLGYNEAALGNVILDQNLALTFLNKLLFPEFGEGWEEDLKEMKLAGEEKLGEQDAYRLVLSTETQQFGESAKMDLIIWVQKGDQPFLLAIEPDMSQLFPEEEGQPKMNLAMMNRWSEWDVSPTFQGADFAVPELGDGMKLHSNVEEMMHAQTAEANPSLTLTGKPAEEFEFPLIGGGQAKLSDWKGKVVVLGFWAAMLGDESGYLGVLQEVHQKLKERGVQLFAVNLGDTSEVAEAYLKKGKWSVPVALDLQQSAMTSYKVRSIPQTVVVGKTGEVMQVHVGTDEAFEEELIAEITRLVDDKQGAPAAPK